MRSETTSRVINGYFQISNGIIGRLFDEQKNLLSAFAFRLPYYAFVETLVLESTPNQTRMSQSTFIHLLNVPSFSI